MKTKLRSTVYNPDYELRIHPPKKDDGTRYILQDKDGDYVELVQSTGLETVKLHFVFTPDREKAREFTELDLFWKQATNPIGTAFISGFGGAHVTKIK